MTKLDLTAFQKSLEELKSYNFNLERFRIKIEVPNARVELFKAMSLALGCRAEWLPPYEEVAKWLSNNEGKGLLLFGNCGQGKSLIATKALPVIINHYMRILCYVYNGQEMNKNIDRIKEHYITVLDDIGTEGDFFEYGNRRLAFPEIVDSAEVKNKLLIITTNLSEDAIADKYGTRTMDRLVGLTKRILFDGEESLRK